MVADTDPYAPASVAVYRLFNLDGALLYIGITDNPKRRFAQHAQDKGWWYLVVRWVVEWYPNRDAALAEEARAIREEVPAYNIAGVPEGAPEVDVHRRWLAYLRQGRPAGEDGLNALFLALVTVRSLPGNLWPQPHTRWWHPDKAFDIYLAAKDQATGRALRRHRRFIASWNAQQEQASARLMVAR